MAEEALSGTETPAEPVNVMTAPEVTQAPQEPTPTQPVPSGGGKTVEQVAAELEELKEITRSAEERAARLEHENQLQRNIYEQLTRDRGRPQEQVPTVPDVSDDEFLTNPAKATGKIIDSYFQKERAERERERVEQYVSQARSAYEAGRAEALKSDPALFRGIDQYVSTEMFNMIQSSLRAGQPVDTSALKDPKYWRAAAVAKRIVDGEDISKYVSKSHTPMAPVHSETPTPGAPPQGAVSLSPEQEEVARVGGFTREQFAEMLNKERNIEAGRRR